MPIMNRGGEYRYAPGASKPLNSEALNPEKGGLESESKAAQSRYRRGAGHRSGGTLRPFLRAESRRGQRKFPPPDARPVPGYNGYYVNNRGDMWGPLSQLRPTVSESGHLKVNTNKGRDTKTLFIHKAVLLTFVGPCPKGYEARHLDGNPQNNDLSNLCWSNHSDNEMDKVRHGTSNRGQRHGLSKITSAQAIAIRQSKDTQQSLSDQYGISRQQIGRIRRGERWGWL